MSAPTPAQLRRDIWHDPDGIWLQVGPHTFGPFAAESAAEAFEDELADGRASEPDVEPDWNDPDDTLGYGGSEPEEGA